MSRIKKTNILEISILGYGINITTLHSNPPQGEDGSLRKFGIKKFWGRWDNPYLTIIAFYRWITFRLLMNRN